MDSITPRGEQIKELKQVQNDKPFVMINLLKFKKTTASGEPGINKYKNYAAKMLPMLQEIGARVVWHGNVAQVFIGNANDTWDQVLLVEYPSRKSFLQMIARSDYQEIHQYREEALEKSVLLASQTIQADAFR